MPLMRRFNFSSYNCNAGISQSGTATFVLNSELPSSRILQVYSIAISCRARAVINLILASIFLRWFGFKV